MLKAHRYRIYPNQKQREHLVKAMGCARYIFNKALDLKISTYKTSRVSLSYIDLANGILKEEKELHEWLKEPAALSLQSSLRHLDVAFKNFFANLEAGKRPGFPQFKRKGNRASIQYPQDVKVDFKRSKIHLPKCGEIFAALHRKFEGKVKTCTVSRAPSGKFFISVLVDNGEELPKKAKSTQTIGIDLGLKHFAILSDGTKIDNPRFLKTLILKLKREQRKLSRKQKGSNNRNKQRIKVAKLHEKISNQRLNFLHQLSHKLISENQAFCLEDLAVANMIKNHRLAQGIADVSWSKFVELLTYKAEWYGKHIIQIDRFAPTSKTCSCCGHVNNDLALKDREWTCPSCHSHHDRDINAAINIKNLGHKQLMLSQESIQDRNDPQEPAEILAPANGTDAVGKLDR